MDNFHLVDRLNPAEVVQAKEDLRQCRLLSERERDILEKIIEGVKTAELANVYQLPRQSIHQLYKISLVKIWRVLGPREWIRRISKDKIVEWNITCTKFFTEQ